MATKTPAQQRAERGKSATKAKAQTLAYRKAAAYKRGAVRVSASGRAR